MSQATTTIRADLPAGGGEPRTLPARLGRRLGVLLFALVVVRGVVLMCILPPFEGWDEYQHVAYVQHLREADRQPVAGRAVVSPDFLAQAVQFPHPDWAVRDLLGGVGGVGYARFWDLREAHQTPGFRDVPVSLYQAQHGPLSYRILQPVFMALGGIESLRSSIGGMRFVNLLLTAGGVGLAFACLRRQLVRRSDAGLIGLALAAHPLFLLNGVRVANDALGVFLATLAVWLGIALASSFGQGLSRRRLTVAWLAAGVLTGLAAMAKATNFALVPFAGFCVLIPVIRSRADARRSLIAGTALGVGFVVVTQSEIRFNLLHYGSVSSMQEAAVNHSRGAGAADLLRTAASIPWGKAVADLWSRRLFFAGGWSFLHSHPRAVGVYGQIVAMGLFGWAWGGVVWITGRGRCGRRFANPVAAPACAVLVASYTAALAYHMVQSKLAWGASSTGPWYASPALPWFLTLIVAGSLRLPVGDRLRPALPLGLAAASLAAEFIGFFGQMVPTYTGFAPWPIALERLSWLQPWWLGTPTLFAAATVEIIVLAALVLAWRDEAQSERTEATSRDRGPSAQRRVGVEPGAVAT